MSNPLEMSREELLRGIEGEARRLGPSFNLYYGELQRRDQEDQAKAMKKLNHIALALLIVSTAIAVAAFFLNFLPSCLTH